MIEVAAAIILDEAREKCLITRRKEGEHLAGYWEFPGGKIIQGEELDQCVIREVSEELDIEISVERKMDTIDYTYPEKSVRLHFFLCRHVSGHPKSIGCSDFNWVGLKNLTQYKFPPANEGVINKLVGLIT